MNTLEEVIAGQVARWDQLTRYAGPTNEELGEQAIAHLYTNAGKKPPQQVVWCDSPYQMVTVPVVMTTILQGKTWRGVCARMKKHIVESAEWEQQWQIEWPRLVDKDIQPILPLLSREWRSVDQTVINAFLEKLQSSLQNWLTRKSLPIDSIPIGPPANGLEAWMRAAYRRTGINAIVTEKSQDGALGLATLVAAQAHFKIKIPSWWRIALYFALSPLMYSGFWLLLLVRGWDAAMNSHQLFLRVLDLSQEEFPAEIANVVKRIEDSCESLANQSRRMNDWMLQSPLRPPTPAQLIMPTKAPSHSVDFENRREVVQWWFTGSWLQKCFRGVRKQLALRRSSTLDVLRYRLNEIHITWFPFAASWLPFALACRMVHPELYKSREIDMEREIDCWANLAEAGAGYYFTNSLAFACRKPLALQYDHNGSPHNDSGPTIVWRDSYCAYSWRGILIEAELIEDKPAITLDRISNEKNVEIKRVMIEIYGESRYLAHSGMKLIHQDKYGELYRLEKHELHGYDEAPMMVKVKNSTPEPDGTYKHYFLRVPPLTYTARAAVAWTFHMSDESEYHPQFES